MMNQFQLLKLKKFTELCSDLPPQKFFEFKRQLDFFLSKKKKTDLNKFNFTEQTSNCSQSNWSLLYSLNSLLDCDDIESFKNRAKCLNDFCSINKKRFKFVFFTQEFSLWPSYESIWNELQTRNDVEQKVVYVYDNGIGKELKDSYYKENIRAYQRSGVPIIEMDNFELYAENPDLIFYMKPYLGFRGCPESFFVSNVSKDFPHCAYVSYCLDVQGGEEVSNYFYSMPAFYYMWRIVGYSKSFIDKYKKLGFRGGKNIAELGHPKFDCSYASVNGDKYKVPEWSKKIQDRPTLLWNAHFTIEPGKGVGTFYQWSKTIFDFFKSHEEFFLIWRPHPLFWRKLDDLTVSEKKKIDDYVREISSLQNVIVDRNPDYRFSFRMSDALMSDAATFLVEYGITGKPVLFTPKKDGNFLVNDTYLQGLYVCIDKQDFYQFMHDLPTSLGKNVDARRTFFQNEFGMCDGKNGARIVEYLLNNLRSEAELEAENLYNEIYGK